MFGSDFLVRQILPQTRKHKERPKVTVKEARPGKAAEGRREVTNAGRT